MSRLFRITAAMLSVATLAGAAVAFAAATKSASADKVARGKYLVSVMGCTDCHTPGHLYGGPNMAHFLAGSEMGWAGPWGVVYAANLTSDPETGLGKWSEAEIAKAVRTGNRPDGRQLAPIMPWMNFSHLTDSDAMALAAYVKTLPAVKHAVPAPVAPGQPVTGSVLTMPPPSAWDAPVAPPDGH